MGKRMHADNMEQTIALLQADLAAARERCAKIADNLAGAYQRLGEIKPDYPEPARYYFAKRDALREVAALLRSAPAAGGGT